MRTTSVLAADPNGLAIARFELIEPGPYTTTVNRDLLGPRPPSEPTLEGDLYQCRRQSLGWFGEDGVYHERDEPRYLTRRWLSITSFYDLSCGGAHPSEGKVSHTWDLATGNEVNLWSWLAGSSDQSSYRASDALNAVIRTYRMRQRGNEPSDCDGEIEANASYDLHLSDSGMVFAPDLSHACYALGGEVEVPYRALLPFSTAVGNLEMGLLTARTESDDPGRPGPPPPPAPGPTSPPRP